MAILFTTDISQTNILFSHQNNVVVFKSDSVKKALKVEITINGEMFVIYPNPLGVFYYNFYQYIQSSVNTKNLADDLNVDLSTAFIYNSEAGTYLENSIGFKIIFIDSTFEIISKSLKWILGCLQIEDYKSNPTIFPINAPFILGSKYVKYFEGYPFDISVYVGVSTKLQITNELNLLFIKTFTPSKVNRIIFSDGNIDSTINDTLSIANGINDLKITSNAINVFLELEKQNNCDGVYLKWLNNLGGWSYWLFEKESRVRNTKDLGEVQNDYYNPIDTIGPTISIGKTSKDIIKTTTGIISLKEINLLESIIDSPKIYYFKGIPFSKNNFNDWIEVSLKTSSIILKNAKRNNFQFNIELEMPDRNTIKL